MNYSPVPAPPQPPRLSLFRPSSRPVRTRSGGWALLAVILSLLLHGAALGLVSLLARRSPPLPPPAGGAVQLLMVEQKGTEAAPPAATSPPSRAARPHDDVKAAPKPSATHAHPAAQPAHKAEPPPPPAAPTKDAIGAPPPAKPQPTTEPPQKESPRHPVSQAAPPPQPRPPVFNLNGTDSDSNAEVMPGGGVLPASPDDRFRNRPPPYPDAAARRREQGLVAVVIHVGADGRATGVDVTRSSGYPVLDQAAVRAALSWRFRPAMRGAQPVPFDLPFRFDFRAD